MSAKPSTTRFSAGAVAASLALVLGSGAGYRSLVEYYARPSASVTIPRGTLKKIPVEIAQWVGRDQKLDAAVIRATDTDDLVNRVYARPGSNESVSLYVAYGVRFRDLAPHRPEVCYPGAGWTLEQTEDIELQTADGTSLPCRVLQFKRSGLATEQVTVLNYFIVDGQFCPDVSLLRSKAWKRDADARYAAQVQIACGGALRRADADRLVREFASVSTPVILDVLKTAVQKAKQVRDEEHG